MLVYAMLRTTRCKCCFLQWRATSHVDETEDKGIAFKRTFSKLLEGIMHKKRFFFSMDHYNYQLPVFLFKYMQWTWEGKLSNQQLETLTFQFSSCLVCTMLMNQEVNSKTCFAYNFFLFLAMIHIFFIININSEMLSA